MATDPALVAQTLVLVKAQAASRDQVSSATQRAVAALVRLFTGWGDRAAVSRLAKQLAATTRAGQRQTVTSTAAYWARVASTATGQRVPTARLVDPAATRPVPLDVVFGRLADQYRWLDVSRGPGSSPEDRLRYAIESHTRRIERLAGTLDAPGYGEPAGGTVAKFLGDPREDISARELADRIDRLIAANPAPTVPPEPLTREQITDRVVDRAVVVADQSLTLAMRGQLAEAARRDPSLITGYRRVIHPELSAGGTCGLCVAASTRIYSKEVMLPIHGRCRCTITPVIGSGRDGDVGGAINELDLATLYERAGGVTAGRKLKETRWRVVEHGELGPVLVSGDQTITLQPQQ